jgi:hypothetical protein
VLDIYDDTKQHQKVGFVNYVIICWYVWYA